MSRQRTFGCGLILRPRLLATILILVAALGSDRFDSVTLGQDAPSPEEVLNRLRAVDDLYASGLTARGTELEQSPDLAMAFGGAAAPPPPGKRERKATLSFTVAGDREAATEDYLTQFPGAGVPGRNGSSAAPLHKTAFILSGDSSTIRRFISPKGPADRQSSTDILLRSGPRNVWFDVRVLWSLGRGYSGFIDEVHSVSITKGLIQLEATGVLVNPTDRGRWSLTIDPELNYAVTRARYAETGPNSKWMRRTS